VPSLSRSTAVMTVGTVLSRLTGVARLAAIAAAIGAAETRLADTYNLANTAPNIIYELILGGILTSVFVPVFVELLEKEGRERAWEVASAVINLTLIVLTAVTVIGILAAPWIAKVYATRLEGDLAVRQQEVLTFLLRLFIPQMIFYGLTAVTTGLLNAHRRFGAPMYTPVLNNLAVIAIFIAFRQSYQSADLGSVTTGQMLLIGLGTTAGVVLMAVAQLPFLRGLGRYRATLSLAHPSIKKIARLSIFVIGYVMANQVGYLIVQWLANEEQGGYSAYTFAFVFFMLPHGLFSVSVVTALLPGMSASAVGERWPEFRAQLSTGIRATLLLILPAAIGYFVLADPIISLLLERGVFSARSTDLVADVLRVFVVGLVPFSLFQLFLRAFYSLQDTRTPFLVNCACVVLNIAVNIPAFEMFGVQGLAAGHAISYVAGAFLQARLLGARVGGLGMKGLAGSLVRIAAAAAGMGLLVWLTLQGMEAVAPGDRLWRVVVPVAAGGLSYLVLTWAFGVRELDFIRRAISRRAPDDSNSHD
jgi:putative peptidoglycan lipid II flippase